MANPTTTERIPNQGQLEPTQYILQGYDIQITYSSSSITGRPQFTYNSLTENRTFSGSEITREETGLGVTISVLLKNNQADEGFEGVSLLLPAVQLTSETRQVSIQTLAILNRRIVFVAPGARQLQNYNPILLAGTAEFVQF
jgi:hypothetical protein